MAENAVYVITGANRGIGLGLVEAYLTRPSTTVVGIVRSDAAAISLKSVVEKVAKGDKSVLQIVQLDLSKLASPGAVRDSFLTATSGISHINTVICSAGHTTPMCPTIAITAEHLREAFKINTIAPLTIFQALWPLMENGVTATSVSPKFIVLSSSLGSIGAMEPFPGGAYGASKAAVNYIVKSLHVQMAQGQLVSVALHPGWVQTTMGNLAAKEWGYDAGPPDTVEDSVKGILKVVDEASRENMSGKFVTQTGIELPW
jgi:NAD(P)-dependent dehydrogenase (short-subunit alcohol dehydrogenase family)